MHKVRFNLGAGNNYMKWKVTYPDGSSSYYDPEEWSLEMLNCKLRNQAATAEKIFQGSHKTVCAWVDARQVTVTRKAMPEGTNVSYNPRVAPYWRVAGKKADNRKIKIIWSNGRKLFTTNK